MKTIIKILSFLSVILLGYHPGSFAQTLVYNQSFISGSTPTVAECSAWVTFCASLLGTYSYTGFKINGSAYPPGISCTVPSIALTIANALRTATATTVVDAVDGQTWYVGVGCVSGISGCGGTGVELSNQGTCSCATGYSVRPMINNDNWGGINGSACLASSQTLIVTFYAGPNPPTVTGDSAVCEGATITLTATSSLSSPVFTWSGPGSFSFTGPTITVPATIAAAGVYSCSVTSGGLTSSPTLDTIVVIPLPTITLGANPIVCRGGTVAHLPYIATTGAPTTYSIIYSPAALATGFTNVTGAALPVSPITLTVPSGAPAGTYSGTLTVSHWICESDTAYPFNVIVTPLPAPITGLTNICTGTNTTLADTSRGGTWASGNTAVATIGVTTGVVTGVSTGSSIISFIDGGPTCLATTTVTVRQSPSAIGGIFNICSGTTTLLTEAAIGGVWSSGNILVAAIGSGTGIVTGVSSGTAHISYSVSGCGFQYATLTVNPTPSSITGIPGICLGDTSTFSDLIHGGTWRSSNASVATISAIGLATGISAGETIITYTLPGGCYKTTSITVSATVPPVTGTFKICIGDTTRLGDPDVGGIWSSSNRLVATIGSGTGLVTGVAVGTVVITYSLGTGCTTTATITIKSFPYPGTIAGGWGVCKGSTLLLTDTVAGGIWSCSITNATITSTGMVTGILAGTDTVTYTVINAGCPDTIYDIIDIYPLPNAGAITGQNVICKGGSAMFSDSVSGGVWSCENITVAIIDSVSGTINALSVGTTTITYNAGPNVNGCINSTTFPLSIIPSTLKITGTISDITCYGSNNGSIAATTSGGTGHYLYTWYNHHTESAINNLPPGSYTLIVKDTSTHCTATDSFTITQPDSLLITADVENDTCKSGDGSISTTVTGGTPSYKYLWSNNATGGMIAKLLAGTYTLMVTDNNSCQKNFSAVVADTCTGISVHDVITPNGDGINDAWVIEGLQDYPKNTVQVFDKWGNLVYEKSNYNNDWDGRGSNGELLPDGTYYYLVKLNAENAFGGKNVFTGAILIKR